MATTPTRHVSLLGVSYNTYAMSLYRLLERWLAETMEEKPPVKMDQSEVDRLLAACHTSVADWDSVDEREIKIATDKLLKLGVLEHLKTAVSHRRWVKRSHQLIVACGAQLENPSRLTDLVEKHDVSKFTASEVLGYSVMFGKGIGIKNLTDPEEKREWELSLQAHYDANPHHPQYFKTSGADSNTSAAMLDVADGKVYLEESLIDMLACRGERDLKLDTEFSLSKWLDLPSVFFRRYTERDCDWVQRKLQEWRNLAARCIDDGTDASALNVIHDENNDPRPVTA